MGGKGGQNTLSLVGLNFFGKIFSFFVNLDTLSFLVKFFWEKILFYEVGRAVVFNKKFFFWEKFRSL